MMEDGHMVDERVLSQGCVVNCDATSHLNSAPANLQVQGPRHIMP